MTSLAGRVAIVTGSAGGLGEGIARRLAAEGARVVCADIADAGPVAASLPEAGNPGHRAARLDVTDKEAFETLITEVASEYGRLDVLCNNAGTYDSQPIVEATDASFRRQFEINAWSTFVGCRAAGRVMRDQRWGGSSIPPPSSGA